jgi:aminopeptidase N
MVQQIVARRVIALAFAALFILSSFDPASLAQSSAGTEHAASAKVSAYKQLEGTTHTRAPRTYDILNYTIRTRFDVPGKTVNGDETVTLKPLAGGFQTFTLDASSMKVNSVEIVPGDTALRFTQSPDKLSIMLDRVYEAAATINVRIRYHARPRRGLYFIPQTQGTAHNISKPAQIWTQGEPEDNHHWFPCYDFPDDKVTSEQFITTGANEVAISNGALIETINNADGTRTFHWKMDQPHASYLISLIVGDYVKLTDSYKNIPVEYYTYRGTEDVARKAFGKTPRMMEWFSRELGYEYPYNKYAQTIVNYFVFGGMENITATTQADSEILRDGDDEGPGDSKENLVSHELAHSWFGNLVTCKDWSHVWLNEGFATFMEAAFREQEAGHDAYLAELREDARLYFEEDKEQYRRPLVYARYREPVNLFDATLYKKGALVLHMLRETVGDEMFWKAVNKYLNDNQYKPVETADLMRAFEQTTGKKLDWFFDQWVYKAGYPELRLGYFYNQTSRVLSINVSQTQTPDASTPAVFRLLVDVEITTAQGARIEHIDITQRQQQFTFQLDDKPLKIVFDKGSRTLMKGEITQSSLTRANQRADSISLMNSIGPIEMTSAKGSRTGGTARAASR